MAHKKFNKDEFRALVEGSGLSYQQICDATKITKPWFRGVVEGRFQAPNPLWVKRVEEFIGKYKKIQFRERPAGEQHGS